MDEEPLMAKPIHTIPDPEVLISLYDAPVFYAFKEVEVAVRGKGKTTRTQGRCVMRSHPKASATLWLTSSPGPSGTRNPQCHEMSKSPTQAKLLNRCFSPAIFSGSWTRGCRSRRIWSAWTPTHRSDLAVLHAPPLSFLSRSSAMVSIGYSARLR